MINIVPAVGESLEMEPNKLDICSKATSEIDLLRGCKKYKCMTIQNVIHLTQHINLTAL